ncbi:TPA: UbiA family prenyltransferase [Candidatus Micrarchaeota archaeon]|nr:UbiA family prenyltransferase [Candidatus Micrarchaeota archaeon]
MFELGRPWNALPTALIGSVASLMGRADLSLAALVGLAFFLLYLAGAVVNDIFDYYVDSINMPYRPLERGAVSVREAWVFSAAGYLASLAVAYFLGFVFLAVVVVFILASYLYSGAPLRAESRSFYAQIHLGLVTALLPGLGGFAAALGRLPSVEQMLPFVAFTVFFFFVWVIKDFKDLAGDRARGKFTFLVHVGPDAGFKVMLVGSVVMFPVVVWLFNQVFNNWFFPVVSGAVLVGMMLSEFVTRKDGEKGFAYFRLVFLVFLLALLGSALSLP